MDKKERREALLSGHDASRRQVDTSNISILHRAGDGTLREISPVDLELISSFPKELLHADAFAFEQGLDAYMTSRGQLIENYGKLCETYNLSAEDLEKGPAVVLRGSFLNQNGAWVNQDLKIPHVQEVVLNVETGDFKISSRGMSFFGQRDDIVQEVARNQEQLDIRMYGRPIIEVAPNTSAPPHCTLHLPDGTSRDIDLRELSVLGAAANMEPGDFEKLDEWDVFEKWNGSLAMRGSNEQEFYNIMNEYGLTIQDLPSLHVTLDCIAIDNEYGTISPMQYDLEVGHVYVNRENGEFLIDDKNLQFRGTENSLIDIPNLSSYVHDSFEKASERFGKDGLDDQSGMDDRIQ